MLIYLIISGIACILFPAFSYFGVTGNNNLYSWPSGGAINIAAGYIKFKSGWMLVLVYSGIALIETSISAKLVFKFFPLGNIDDGNLVIHDIDCEEVITQDIHGMDINNRLKLICRNVHEV